MPPDEMKNAPGESSIKLTHPKVLKDDTGAYRVGDALIAHKDVAFQTIKSASFGAMLGAGVVYGISLIFNKNTSIHSKALFSFASVAGGVLALLNGYDSNRKTTYLNDRFDFLEKYNHSADPDGVISLALEHTGHQIKRSRTEDILNNLSLLMMVGGCVSKPQSGTGNIFQKMAYLNGRTNSNIFNTGWAVTAMAWLGAHVTNIEDSISRQRKEFSHAGKLIQERESAALQTDSGLKK